MRYPYLVVFHVSCGMVGLVAGAGAMVLRKGSKRHALAGDVFAVSMLGMSAAGALMGWMQHLLLMKAQMMNVFNGGLTFYLVATGWAAGRRREGTTDARSGVFDWIALLVAVALGGGMMSYGVAAATNGVGSSDGYPAGMYFFFGSVALLAAAGDVRVLVRRRIVGGQRIVRHLWRMSFALFIAATSFFLGQQKVFPAAMRGLKIWYLPPLAVLIAMLFWVIRIKLTKRFSLAGAGERRPGEDGIATALMAE